MTDWRCVTCGNPIRPPSRPWALWSHIDERIDKQTAYTTGFHEAKPEARR